jgi:hypothetical protein
MSKTYLCICQMAHLMGFLVMERKEYHPAHVSTGQVCNMCSIVEGE